MVPARKLKCRRLTICMIVETRGEAVTTRARCSVYVSCIFSIFSVFKWYHVGTSIEARNNGT